MAVSALRAAAGPLLGAALWCSSSPVAWGLVRGLSPEEESKFPVGQPFQCAGLDGKPVVLPYGALNDDYCDCADGSDEPGTGACSGQETTLFHCANKGSTAQMIYASRVDDGICDCCDGSDEAGLRARVPGAKPCPDRCAEEGAIEQQRRTERLSSVRKGLELKQQAMEAAVVNRKEWAAKAAQLEADLPGLESELAKAKKMAQEAAAVAQPDKGNCDGLRAEVEELKKTVQKMQLRIDALEGSHRAHGSHYEEGEGASGAEAKGSEKKVVSEYAKWMDGAESTPGALDDDDEDKLTEMDEDFLDEDHEPALSTKPSVSSGGSKPVGKKPEDAFVRDLEKKVRDSRSEASKLRNQLEQLDDEHSGFSSLIGKCLEKFDGQYTYKLCFYDNAKQDYVSLGRWKGWEGPKTAVFDDGQMCPGGPARMIRVIFECGSEESILDIAEPSRCVYEAHVTSPGACNAEDIEMLEKPPLKHPRHEL